MRKSVNMLRNLTTIQASRYIELTKKLIADLNGVKLDLNDPCDRSILEACNLSKQEAFELLSLYDALNAPDFDDLEDTQRISTQEMRAIK